MGKVKRRILFYLVNQPWINKILIFLRLDYKINQWIHAWQSKAYKQDKSLQENVGYSHLPAIQALVDRSHEILQAHTRPHLKEGQAILDIGCGTGLYLRDFDQQGLKRYGVDLNAPFIQKASELLPDAHLYVGDYLNMKFNESFHLIYTIGVFMYFVPSRVDTFFKKVHNEMAPGGMLFLQYTHALSEADVQFRNLAYMRYSPSFVAQKASKWFNIEKHEHFFDGRQIERFDPKPYFYPDGTNSRIDTIENSYLLIGRKKG